MRKFDISQITDQLFISGWPSSKHIEIIKDLEVDLIISMHWIRPSPLLNKSPLKLLWLPTFDNPLLRIPIETLKLGVETALPVINQKGKVLTHCRAGRHRSVAMACCILIASGYSAADSMELIARKRAIADPNAWYIRDRINMFAKVWNHKNC